MLCWPSKSSFLYSLDDGCGDVVLDIEIQDVSNKELTTCLQLAKRMEVVSVVPNLDMEQTKSK